MTAYFRPITTTKTPAAKHGAPAAAKKNKMPDLKTLRGVGHKLSPIVTIGANGTTETLIDEVARALADHELIKLKLPAGDSKTRRALADELAQKTGATVAHQIGRIALFYKSNPQANPKLSNLARFGL